MARAQNQRKFDYAIAQRMFLQDGLTKAEIGRRLGVSTRSVCNACAEIKDYVPRVTRRQAQGQENFRTVVDLILAKFPRDQIAKQLGLSRSHINHLVFVARKNGVALPRGAKQEPAEIPSWVPDWLHEDHRLVDELVGPEAAASWCRQRKAEAAASCR